MTTNNAWLTALAVEHMADLARQNEQHQQNPRVDDAGTGQENDDTGRDE